MKRKIKLIIKNNDQKNNNRESLVSVQRGYALNYLIPRKNGKLPTNKHIKHLEMFEKIKEKREAKNQKKVNLLRRKLESIDKISLYKKIGGNNLIFGSITEKDIIQWIGTNTYIETDTIQVNLSNTKETGIISAKIETKQNIVHIIQINVIPINI